MTSSTGSPSIDVFAVVLDLLLASDRAERGRGSFVGSRRRRGPMPPVAAVRASIAQRQVEGERAALPCTLVRLDFAPQQHRQLAADRQAETGAAILARGAGVGLLECLEDQPLLLGRDADSGVLDGERDDLLRLAQHRMIDAPALTWRSRRARRHALAR